MLGFMALACGALLAVTVMQNGDLSAYMGNYHATVAVHAVGLVAILLWMLARREKLGWSLKTPWYAYFGGALGVLTVVGCNVTYTRLGVSVPLALGLLGQALAGGTIEHFGWFGSPQRRFRKAHLLSFALIVGGVAAMLWL